MVLESRISQMDSKVQNSKKIEIEVDKEKPFGLKNIP